VVNALYALLVRLVLASEGVDAGDSGEEGGDDARAQHVGQSERESRESSLVWGQQHKSYVEPVIGVMGR
jgi:hypothetical protein